MWLLRVVGTLGVFLLLALYMILWVKVAQWLGTEPKLSSWGMKDWGSPGIWFVACFVAMIPFVVGIYLYLKIKDWYWRSRSGPKAH